ncbi:MAG TPA: MBL fold metallo-hydrolase, partial [Flavobacteriales bacterium]|nr:MBL fold metallo-hydrolase [Flavobacteriales bacterium]
MKIEQLYTNCLAEAAYYIESEGEIAIIDPLRESDPYLEKAKASGGKIKYIFETHFHADFVSGHVDLAAKTGATIVYGPDASTNFKSHIAKDGEVFTIGKITITVLHTPGHTLESTTYLLKDEYGKPHCIFTGDTLFIGDVGRPDLAIKSDVTKEDLAGMMFDSLRTKIMPLPDDVIVYPGHGAGSSCGKNLSSETWSTLGEQKKTNYALKGNDKAAFVKELTTGIMPAPQYFAKNAALNKNGYDKIDDVVSKGNTALTLEQFDAAVKNGALILDVRTKEEFSKAFIPGSIFIGLEGTFAMWVGALVT